MFLESEGFKEELIKAIFINIQVCKVYRSYRVCFNISPIFKRIYKK